MQVRMANAVFGCIKAFKISLHKKQYLFEDLFRIPKIFQISNFFLISLLNFSFQSVRTKFSLKKSSIGIACTCFIAKHIFETTFSLLSFDRCITPRFSAPRRRRWRRHGTGNG